MGCIVMHTKSMINLNVQSFKGVNTCPYIIKSVHVCAVIHALSGRLNNITNMDMLPPPP